MPLPTSAWPLHNDSQHYNTHAASLQRSPINPAAMISVQSAYTTGGGGGNPPWSQPPSGGGTSRSYQQQPSTLQAQQYQRPPSLSSQQSQYQGGHEYAQQQPAKMLSHNASNLSAITQSYAHANSPSSANANLPTQMQYPMQPSYAYDTMASAPSPSLVSASSTSQASSSAAASYGAYPSANFAAHIPPSSAFGQGRAANAGTASQYQHATHPGGGGGGGGSVSIHGNYESTMLSAARYPQYTYQNASAPNNEYFVSGAASSYPDSHLHRATSSPATTSTMYADAPRGGSMFVTSPGSIYGSLPSNHGGGGGGRGIGRTMSIVHKRVPAACSFCRMRKLRCDGQEPCRQCSRRSLACVYSEGAETRRKRRATTSIVGTSSARIGEPPSVVKPLPFINSSNSSSSSAGSGTATGMYAYQPRHSPVHEQWQPSPSMYARPQVTVRAPTQRMYDQQPMEQQQQQQQQQPSGTQASFQQAPAHSQHMSAHTSPEQQKMHVQQWTPTSELYALDPSSVSDTTASIAGSAALPSGLASDAFGGGNDDHAGDETMQSSSSYATHPLSVDLLRDGGGGSGGDHYKASTGKPLRPTHHHV